MVLSSDNTLARNGQDDLRRKLARLESGESLRVLDLFSGCGGLSLGFHRAGLQIVGAVESDQKAARSHAVNFLGETHSSFETCAQPHKIEELPPEKFTRGVLNAEGPVNQVDVIVGGPPCQAFARIGRAKLREVMNDPRAHLNDGRASLYVHFLKYVEYFRPLAVVIENVPEMMNFGGTNVAEEIAVSLDDLGYRTRYTLLNAAYYGVPQLRHRVFLLALIDPLGIEPTFPAPTHYIELPDGYADARQSVLKGIPKNSSQLGLFDKPSPRSHYMSPPDASASLAPAISAREAMGDLPLLYSRQITGGARTFVDLALYRQDVAASEYAQQMREWPGFEAELGVVDHVTRYLPRDYRIFKKMRAGDEYPRAREIARRLFRGALASYIRYHGHRPHGNSTEYRNLLKRYVPPYDPGKFPNKWCKIDPARPVRTLTAHLGKDSYTHIHYDSEQSRTITVREAARLQSFPDGFRFEGPMNAAFRQIGNAVPPLVAFAIASQICGLICRARLQRPSVHMISSDT